MSIGAERVELEAEGWLPLGGTFQGYDIESVLGIGGISIVYRVRHHFLGRVQALKVLKMQHTRDKHLRDLARNEALALARIQHTNLVSVSDAGLTDEGIVWMVMPLLEGLMLRDYMQRADFPLLEALRVAVEVCDGVYAAHEHGVIHRDVKPENVFVTKTYQVVVLDLGMAKFLDFGMSSTGQRKPLGTVRYMSPEQLLSQRVDGRTDVYSIGMMLYEMIARHPFEVGEDGVTRLDKMQMGMAHIHREPPPLRALCPECPEPIAAMVHRAIAKDREARFSTVQAFAQAIRAEGQKYEKALRTRPGGLAQIPPTREPGSRRQYVSAQPLDTATSPLLPSQRVVVHAPAARSPVIHPTEPLPASFTDPAKSAIVAASRRSPSPSPVVAFATTEPHAAPRSTPNSAPHPAPSHTLEMPRVAAQRTEPSPLRAPSRGARWASYAVGSTALGIGVALVALWVSGVRAPNKTGPAASVELAPAAPPSAVVTPAASVPEAPPPPSSAAASAIASAAAAPATPAPKKPVPAPNTPRASGTSLLPAVPTADWTKLPPEEQPRF